MKNYLFCIVLFLFIGCSSINEEDAPFNIQDLLVEEEFLKITDEHKESDSLDIDFQMAQWCVAYSSNKNSISSNGEYQSGNLPHGVQGKFEENGLYLILDSSASWMNNPDLFAHSLYLINTSDTLVEFVGSDSRLDIIAEAQKKNHEWAPISFLEPSWCGNSYHIIKLGVNEYWKFQVPIYKGTESTKLRYTLKLSDGRKIYSNEISTQLNLKQFDPNRKEGFPTNNVMDPY